MMVIWLAFIFGPHQCAAAAAAAAGCRPSAVALSATDMHADNFARNTRKKWWFVLFCVYT